MLKQWFLVRKDASEFGPLTPNQLRKLVVEGRINPNTRMRREDCKRPVRAGNVSGLFASKSESPPSDKPTMSQAEVDSPKRDWLLVFASLFILTLFGSAIGGVLLLRSELVETNKSPQADADVVPMLENAGTSNIEFALSNTPRATPAAWFEQLAIEERKAIEKQENDILREKQAVVGMFSGIWKGVYYEYPSFIGIELRFASGASPGADAHGEILLAKYQEGRQGENSAFHVFAKGTFHLSVGNCSTAVIACDRLLQIGSFWEKSNIELEGVVSFEPREFAGEHIDRSTQNPGFILRPSVFPQLDLWDTTASLHEIRTNYQKIQVEAASLENFEALERWANRLADEYPTMESSVLLPKVRRKTVNLFDDKYFEPAFGLPFDRLHSSEANSYYWLIEKAVNGKYGDEVRTRAKVALSWTSRAFRLGGSGDALATIAQMWPRRTIRRWLGSQIESIPKQERPSLSADYDILRRHASGLFPSEIALIPTADEAAEEFDASLALAVCNTVNTSSLQTYNLESLLEDVNAQLNALEYDTSSKAARDEADRLLRDHTNFLISRTARNELEKLSQPAADIDDVIETNSVQYSIRELANQANGQLKGELDTILDQLNLLRDQQLGQLRAEIADRIAKVQWEPNVTRLVGQLLNEDVSARLKNERLVAQFASKRIKEIEKAFRESLLSKRELLLLDKAGRIDTSGSITNPTPDEIRLALLRSHAPLNGRMATPTTYEYAIHVLNPLNGFEPMPTWVLVRINDVRILESRQEANSRRTYRVSFQLKEEQHLFTPLDSSDQLLGMVNNLGKSITGNRWGVPREETFFMSEDGWISPSVVNHFENSEMELLGKAYRHLDDLPSSEIPDLIELERFRSERLQRR
ncbi:MAG: hypothetical protein Aurels2KO_57390 [Aureliella sp.]